MASHIFYMSKTINYYVLIVGVGGTGGMFSKEFCRFSAFAKAKNNIHIGFLDGDTIEEKNASRQPYLVDDIALSKANVLAETVGDALNITVKSFPFYITELKHLEDAFTSLGLSNRYNEINVPILIGAVDNHRARQVMHDYFMSSKNCLYIDSANEFSTGEVVFGFKYNSQVLAPPRSYYYPEVLTDTSPNVIEASCERINESSPQHIATNQLASNIMLAAVTDFIENGVTPNGIVYFDAFKFFVKKRVFQVGEQNA